MQNQFIEESDYCSKCGVPLLFPNKPCPKCNEVNQNSFGQLNTTYYGKDNFDNSLICHKERVYFVSCLIVSIFTYLIMILTVAPILYLIFIGVYLLVNQGVMIGYIRGNAIKVSENQFPEVYESAVQLSQKLGLPKMPDIYVLQAGGSLNAFATHFFDRNFAVIFSDVLELAYKEGAPALDYIVCHELVHIN